MKKLFITIAVLAILLISSVPVIADDDNEQFCFWKYVKGRIVRVCWPV